MDSTKFVQRAAARAGGGAPGRGPRRAAPHGRHRQALLRRPVRAGPADRRVPGARRRAALSDLRARGGPRPGPGVRAAAGVGRAGRLGVGLRRGDPGRRREPLRRAVEEAELPGAGHVRDLAPHPAGGPPDVPGARRDVHHLRRQRPHRPADRGAGARGSAEDADDPGRPAAVGAATGPGGRADRRGLAPAPRVRRSRASPGRWR